MALVALRLRLAAALALALVAPAASATIYKCLLEDGSVFYQDSPCPPGRELRDFDKDPATVSVVPFARPPASAAQGDGGSSSKSSGKPHAASTASKSSAARVPKAESKPAKKSAERGDPAQRKFLHPGMSEGEVMARVGPPDMTSSGGRKGQRWTYMPVPEDANTITNLQFDTGRLVEVERKVLK
jgi:hypothetical protein